MKILTISDVFFPRINGVSTSIATFHRELEREGCQTLMLAPSYGTEAASESGIVRIAARRVPFDPEDRMMRSRALRRQLPRLAEERFDIAHIQTPFVAHRVGVALARQLGLPVVETYHTYFEHYLYHYVPFLPRPFLRSMARRFSRSQCDQVDRVIVPSTPMREALREYGVTQPIAKIPTGLRLQEFAGGDGSRFRELHGIAEDRPTLVHVGRIAYEKNIDFLLHVLVRVREHLPETLLIIAGEGPALTHLKDLSRRLDLRQNVLFVGYLSRDSELLDCYLAGDAFVFASRTETQGLVLLEAMALGVPVVSTAVMGTKDVLAGGRGALIAEDAPADFAAKVVRVLSDAELRSSLGSQAREYARTWSAPAMAQRLLDLYREVVSENHGTSAPAARPPRSGELRQEARP